MGIVPWASYQIRKITGCACARNAGNVSPHGRFQRKPLVSDPGMHHGTCVTHVPWCMSGSLTCGDGENVPGIPGACAPAILRIWQESHRLIHISLWYNLISDLTDKMTKYCSSTSVVRHSAHQQNRCYFVSICNVILILVTLVAICINWQSWSDLQMTISIIFVAMAT